MLASVFLSNLAYFLHQLSCLPSSEGFKAAADAQSCLARQLLIQDCALCTRLSGQFCLPRQLLIQVCALCTRLPTLSCLARQPSIQLCALSTRPARSSSDDAVQRKESFRILFLGRELSGIFLEGVQVGLSTEFVLIAPSVVKLAEFCAFALEAAMLKTPEVKPMTQYAWQSQLKNVTSSAQNTVSWDFWCWSMYCSYACRCNN